MKIFLQLISVNHLKQDGYLKVQLMLKENYFKKCIDTNTL